MEKQRILIVDDDENIAELISLYLLKECFATEIAYTGKDALALAATFNPDLILLDIMLPDIDGYDIIDGNADNNKLTHVGEIGSKLQARFSDFDVRNYGYSKLTTFINEAFGNFEVISQNRQNYVKIIDDVVPKREIEEQIIQILKKLLFQPPLKLLVKLNLMIKKVIKKDLMLVSMPLVSETFY